MQHMALLVNQCLYHLFLAHRNMLPKPWQV